LNNLESNRINHKNKDKIMRVTSILSSLILAFTAKAIYATPLDCININTDFTLIEKLAESGQYRNLVQSNVTVTFDYLTTRSYDEYLAFAKEKITKENPKAALKCPIETGISTRNKSKSDLIVTDLLAPFELKAKNNQQAILLIHGLTDSPFVFHDLAAYYHAKGLNVRTLLLPGHGTAPQALIDIEYENWQQATQFAISKTLEDFEQVYLGGFSTGGALILDSLLSSSQSLDKIKGVILWSPASKAKSSVAWAAQVVDWIPFLDYAHKGADIDFAKYESFPLNAGAQVHALMNKLTDKLNNATSIPDIPLLTIATEEDSTIETKATITLLNKWHNAINRTTKQQDTIFYFGDPTSLTVLPETLTRIFPICDNKLFCENIINVAHTSVTNAPTNPHYGWQGSYRSCETAFGSEHYKACKTSNNAMLGETTSKNLEQHPNLQRLTFNPSFGQMTEAISIFLSTNQ